MTKKENENQVIDIDVSDEDLESEEVTELIPENPLETDLEKECRRSKELLDRLQRLQAEFDNYRKRMDNHVAEATKYASEGILLKLLDIYDNLLRALSIDFGNDPKGAKAGIEAIYQQMNKIFSQEGVRPIESKGKQFDPYYQHAIGTQSNPEIPDGVIAEEYQTGYMLREKVLRPAFVCVNRHEVSSSDASDTENKTMEEDSE